MGLGPSRASRVRYCPQHNPLCLTIATRTIYILCKLRNIIIKLIHLFTRIADHCFNKCFNPLSSANAAL